MNRYYGGYFYRTRKEKAFPYARQPQRSCNNGSRGRKRLQRGDNLGAHCRRNIDNQGQRPAYRQAQSRDRQRVGGRKNQFNAVFRFGRQTVKAVAALQVDMELSFAQQSSAFLWSFVLGASLSALYGVFRLLRCTFSFGKAAVFLLDVIFMLAASVSCFLFSLGFIRGYVRFYVFIGAAIGFVAYRLTAGRLIFSVYSRILGVCRKILNKIFIKTKLFAKKLLKICRKILYNVSGKK